MVLSGFVFRDDEGSFCTVDLTSGIDEDHTGVYVEIMNEQSAEDLETTLLCFDSVEEFLESEEVPESVRTAVGNFRADGYL